MKRILIHSLLSIGLALLLQSFTPWWGVVIATAISSYFIRLKGSSVFFSPLLSIGLLWAIQAYSISSSNDFILAEKIAVLLPLNDSVGTLIALTGLIGGIFGGLGSLSGRSLKVLVS